MGAEYLGNGRTHIRVWAPLAGQVAIVTSAGSAALESQIGGYYGGTIEAGAGDRYQFRIDDGDKLFPDPASRFQPEGPHGPSEIVDPGAFQWTDGGWRGVRLEGQVIYEMHVGTFTRDGTFIGAARELDELARIGITLVEVMPVADFHGRFGWGYDGVNLYAPTRLYGKPDDFRRFVDKAHSLELGVILDVVYNHLGAVGNYLRAFSPAYFTQKYTNTWGEAINFDGADSAPVREFFIANAGYWIDEFHLDGLRLDATQEIHDESEDHILRAIGRRAREAARERAIIVTAENESQETILVRPPEEGGYGLDALWNDDFHHSAMVALTSRAEAYYSDTQGTPQELISAVKYGYLFQGQQYHWQRKPRGTPARGLPPPAFVVFLQNHDQISNSSEGRRGHQLSGPGTWRAMTALLLLMPGTPLLFQGQEFAASTPFKYFADPGPDLVDVVRKGRAEFLSQFPSVVGFTGKRELDDPADPNTFASSVLDLGERLAHAEAYALHRDLLKLRKTDVAFRLQRPGAVDGAVLSAEAFVLRYLADDDLDHRLLIVNLGRDLKRTSFAEPLLAPPAPEMDWTTRWSSEDPAYGGSGTPPFWGKDPADRSVQNLATGDCYFVPGQAALVLCPRPRILRSDAELRRLTA